MEGIVIIGGGQAGSQLALSLRELGYTSPIKLVGDEPFSPYQRPPLSKAFMKGALGENDLPLRKDEHYAELDIELMTGVSAESINRELQTVSLSNGRRLPYEHLVLATGARNRELPFDGGRPANAHYLRTREDAVRLRTELPDAEDILIIGAGFIGLEFATVAAEAGKKVTVLEMAPRVMGRAVSEDISAYFTRRHRSTGVDVLCETSVDEFLMAEDGRIQTVRIEGEARSVDLALIGIGVIPNDELAGNTGLDVDGGIIVDANLSTADPAIHAIGDCARHPRPDTDELVRVESVQNAIDQARFLAQRFVSGTPEYQALPWFWSHQAGDKLQIAGLAQPTDRSVVVGDPTSGKFSVARYRGDRLVAVESVNHSGDHLACRKLLAAGSPIPEEELHLPGFSFRNASHRTGARSPALS